MSQHTEPAAWARRMADTVTARHPVIATRWAYEWGVVLKGILELARISGEARYFDVVKAGVDLFVEPDGSIRTYRADEYNLDQINPGKLLFALYAATGDARYVEAAKHLRAQLATQPRTSEGGFWHKAIYPHQMWLDGIYMASPFLAEYAAVRGEPDSFDDVAHQILLIERHTRDARTGLLYHGWDESKQQRWADPVTGCSPNFWGRAIGWYCMAIPDVLDTFPADHPQRSAILDVFARTAAAVVRVQDAASGLWYQVLDQGAREGNYREASASCMLAYALAKGARLGYLAPEYAAAAQRGYRGIVEQFVSVDADGGVNLNRICGVAGLGGTPYRDGSYAYYVGEPVVSNDFKGVGPFILASLEIARAGGA